MANSIIRLPIDYFPDPTKGRPVFNGSVYIGNPDTDPEVAINRKTVTLRQEDGTEVPITGAGQPLITGAGGVILYNGSPAQVLTNGDYSIKVLNAQGSQVYYVESVNDGLPATIDKVVFKYDTLADAVASTDIYETAALNIAERTTGSGGGAMWDSVLTSSVTPNTYDIVISTANALLSFVIRKSNTMHANMFGAFTGDASSICTPALQAYAAYCDANGVAFTVLSDASGIGEYKLNDKITFTAKTNVKGIGAFLPRFLTEDTGLFKWPDGVTNVRVENVRAGMAIRHTTTPNSHVAIEFPGNTGARPFYNTVEGCFFDGFGININIEWAWEQRYLNNILINCGQMVRAGGACVNNHVIGNSGSGDGLAFQLGDGTGTIEGWWIKENLLDNFTRVLNANGASFIKVNDNIFDHIKGTPGLLFTSDGTRPSIGNHLKGNYIAFSFNASEGVRLLNGLSSTQNTGSTIDDNEIFAYSGFSITKGVLVDGAEELNNTIINNKITASLYDVQLTSAALETNLTNNVFGGGGFITGAACYYSNNRGLQLAAETFLFTSQGVNLITYGTNHPSSGSWTQGDFVRRSDSAVDVNNMILLGWYRLTTSSNNVINVDWAPARASTVSPAN